MTLQEYAITFVDDLQIVDSFLIEFVMNNLPSETSSLLKETNGISKPYTIELHDTSARIDILKDQTFQSFISHEPSDHKTNNGFEIDKWGIVAIIKGTPGVLIIVILVFLDEYI